MPKKIVLVNPPVSMEERYGDLASSGSQSAPLGLCYIGAVLRENGFPARIIDSIALKLSFEALVKKIFDCNPEWIGITASVVAISKASRLASMLKKKNPQVKIIIGGPQVTAVPESTMKETNEFDVGVIGEGEDTVVEIAKGIASDADLSKVGGLILRGNGSPQFTPKRQYIKNLDEIPFPAWDLLPDIRRNYQPAIFASKYFPAFSIITSRGCPAQCTFCDKGVFGSRYRAHSASYCMAMIKKLQESYGIKEFVIADDNFVVFKKRLKEICLTLIQGHYNISWSCNARVDQVDYETLKLMKEAGCWHIGFGIETGSQRILNEMKKKITLDQITKVVRICSQLGYMTKGYFLLGAPLEDKTTALETIKFARSLPLSDFQLSYFTPLPGSEAYHNHKKYGHFEKNFDLMNYFEPTFVPYGMTKKELIYYYRLAYRKFYFRPIVILTFLLQLRSFEYAKKLFLAGFNVLKISIKGILQRQG